MSYSRWNPSAWYVFEQHDGMLELWCADGFTRSRRSESQVRAMLSDSEEMNRLPGWTADNDDDVRGAMRAWIKDIENDGTIGGIYSELRMHR